MSNTRQVTAKQLRDGFYVRCQYGQYALDERSVVIKHGRFEVIKELPDGTFIVKEPDPVLFLAYDSKGVNQ